MGANNGLLSGNTSYGTGRTGQGFVFDGASDAVIVGNAPGLQVQDLTIEAWIKRASSTVITVSGNFGNGQIFAFGQDGYGLYLSSSGQPALSKIGVNNVTSSQSISDTSFHHLAVTKSGSTVVFYIDGTAYPAAPYNPGFQFSTMAAIGARGDNLDDGFFGTIDEVQVFNRALSLTEIQSIYNASSICTTPLAPQITGQPTNQSVLVGDAASFRVSASGTAPLSYQWLFNGTNLNGATDSVLILNSAQSSNSGNYSALVTNSSGSVVSSNALLTVNPQPPCATIPSGLVSWWRAEASALDQAGANHGTLYGNASYGSGRVGQAFVFDGQGDGVQLGNPANLQLQNFTIEAWIQRASSASTSGDGNGNATIFGYGNGGYSLYIDGGSHLALTRFGIDNVTLATPTISDTAFHHVAVTKSGSTVVFYIDGMSYSVPAYNPTFTFATTAGIGAVSDAQSYTFWGRIDEVSVYNRALSTAEVQGIYGALTAGKCAAPTAPVIFTQPTNLAVQVGQSANFFVVGSGTPAVSYQWLFNGASINGATGSSLTLNSVQFSNAGNYSVVLSNSVSTLISSNAVLTVNPLPPCFAPPSGLIAWWQGEGNGADIVGGNTAVLLNGLSFANGEAGQGFNFDGNDDLMILSNSLSVNFGTNDFSIEGWIKAFPNRTDLDLHTILDKRFNQGVGYEFALQGGKLHLQLNGTSSGVAFTASAPDLRDGVFHHIALSVARNSVTGGNLYVDGVVVGTFDPTSAQGTLSNSAPLFVGQHSAGYHTFFKGILDELSFYNRALANSEIQAIYNADAGGKCTSTGGTTMAPFIITQPADLTVTTGGNATFTAVVGGSAPLSYQWSFGGTNIADATTSSFTVNNAQFTDAGLYSVFITNSAGSIQSSNALLTVNPTPSLLQVADTAAASGGTVSVPVSLTANGFENALQFSLSFSVSRLTYVGTTLTSSNGATLLLNESGTSTGRVGMVIGLPAGITFSPGTQQLAMVTFTTAIVTNATTTPVNFVDQPLGRQVSNKSGSALPANYANGTISIAAVELEADLTPRPGGNKVVTVTDWVLVGLFAAHLDSPTNSSEFQKADCAPRDTLGNGAISIIDWVQAGRYAALLDPLTPVGGPTEPSGAFLATARKSNGIEPLTTRQVRVMDSTCNQGQPGTVPVTLQSEGNENALGFSLTFNPASVSYTGATLGNAANGAALNINSDNLPAGRVGFALALPSGTHFAAGMNELLKITFRPSISETGGISVGFGDVPISREISDATARVLSSDYLPATITINPLPSLTILKVGQNASLTWPGWATNFVLQENGADLNSSVAWANVNATVTNIHSQIGVTVPIGGATKFYRLLKQ